MLKTLYPLRRLATPAIRTQIRCFSSSQFTITEDNTLDNLITDLKLVLKDAKTKEDVNVKTTLNLLRYYSSQEAQWSKYAHRNDTKPYTRNLVTHATDNSCLLVLVWEPGKGSSIHDHPESNCFMKILKGSLEERLFNKDGDKLMLQRYTTLPFDSVAYIDDRIGLHQIHNTSNEVAISLHLYAPSYDDFTSFEKNGESHSRRIIGYDSVDGKVTDQ